MRGEGVLIYYIPGSPAVEVSMSRFCCFRCCDWADLPGILEWVFYRTTNEHGLVEDHVPNTKSLMMEG